MTRIQPSDATAAEGAARVDGRPAGGPPPDTDPPRSEALEPARVAVPDADGIRDEIARGLASEPRTLPVRFFYDEEGARLFEAITRLDEYYLTDAEMEILRERAGDVARRLGPGVRMVEYGSGSGEKTWIVLDELSDPSAYVPVDVARRQLERFAARVRRRFPGLQVLPVVADYTELETLPWPDGEAGATLAFFPGSTIGNLEPDQAVDFLRQVGRQTGPGAFALVGVDLVKDPAVLERAYNDAQGVTARFNLNMLRHLNRLLGSDFDLEAFAHRAIWNPEASRIEMHLVSRRAQEVRLGDPAGPTFSLHEGEPIVTEHSYKYEIPRFERLAREAGYETAQRWTDHREWFSVHLLTRR